MADPNLSSFIWSLEDLLRGDYKQSEYGMVILPLTMLRSLDCELEAYKPAVEKKEKREQAGLKEIDGERRIGAALKLRGRVLQRELR